MNLNNNGVRKFSGVIKFFMADRPYSGNQTSVLGRWWCCEVGHGGEGRRDLSM